MVNRILIRIKVVQMLYSYMLTRSEFRIDTPPEKETRDNLYAYQLYIDLLLLILRLSGQKVIASDLTSPVKITTDKNLLAGSLTKSLAAMSELKQAATKRKDSIKRFDSILSDIYQEFTASNVFTDYNKKRHKELADEVGVWVVMLESILLKSESFENACRQDNNFTIAGKEKAFTMIIDTLRDYSTTRSSLVAARNDLEHSLEEAHTLYNALLKLPVEITRLRNEQLENAKDKYLPTSEDLNPNMRFVDNKFVEVVGNSQELEKYFKDCPFSWDTDYFMVKSLLDEILASDIYRDYMAQETTDYANDCEFWRNVFKTIILPSEALAEALESRSVYWNDDLPTIGTFVLKTIRRMATADKMELPLLPMYKDEEDARFGAKLFETAIQNAKEYRELIDKFINDSQWDPERLAFMDIVILTAAITELVTFPSIPVPVTFNEYIEIANYYSTSRSGQFINGILFSIANYLKEEGKLDKSLEKQK